MVLLILIRVHHGAAGLLALIWFHRTSVDAGLRTQTGQATDIEEIALHVVFAQVQAAMVRLRGLISGLYRSVIARIPCC